MGRRIREDTNRVMDGTTKDCKVFSINGRVGNFCSSLQRPLHVRQIVVLSKVSCSELVLDKVRNPFSQFVPFLRIVFFMSA
jgi:hypothetical protein